MRTRPSPKLILPLALLAAGAAGFAWLVATRSQAEPEPPRERAWPVSTTAVERVDVQPEITVFGAVVAGKAVALEPLVAGRLVEVSERMENGAIVEAGELLAVVDPFDYESAVTEREALLAEARARLRETRLELESERELLAEAEAELALRERNLERTRNLTVRGTASEQAHDDAELAVNAARQTVTGRRQSVARLTARIEQQEAAVAQARVALRRARRDLEHTRLTAPFTGFLADVDAAVGKRVRDGDPLGRLIQAGRLEVRFQLGHRDYARLIGAPPAGSKDEGLIGRPLEVRWRVGGETFRYRARLARLGAEIDTSTGGVELYAALEDVGPQAPLRPGAFVEIAVPDREYRSVVRLPEAAVDDQGRLFLVEDGRLAPRRVEILRHVGTDVLVDGDLPGGALVATTRFPEAGPGARVLVR